MNDQKSMHEFDEAHLTAYVLGELPEDERQAIDAALEQDEALKAEVESIRATIAMLESELADEPALVLTEAQRETVMAGPKPVLNDPAVFRSYRTRWISSALAAAAVIALTVTAWLYWDRQADLGGTFAMDKDIASTPTPHALTLADDEMFRVESSFDSNQPAAGIVAPGAPAEETELYLKGGGELLDRAQTEIVAKSGTELGKTIGGQSVGQSTGAQPTMRQADNKRADAAGAMNEIVDARRELDEAARNAQSADGRKVTEEKPVEKVAENARGYAPPATAAPTPPSMPASAPGRGGVSEPEAGGGAGAMPGELSTVDYEKNLKALSDELRSKGMSEDQVAQAIEVLRQEAGAGLGLHDPRSDWTLQARHELSVDGVRGRDVFGDRFRRSDDTDSMRQAAPSNEGYALIIDNPWIRPIGEKALSTFSIDVDTASYANIRRFLTGGSLPPKDAVRIEEMINYFRYDYAAPAAEDEHPFATHIEIADAPWNEKHRLVRIGIKGREIAMDQRPASNLVFLVDVSGSMKPENKLPLLKQSLTILLDHLRGDDMIAIVTYAGNSGLALPPTHIDARESILSAIGNLEAGGSTNGGAGIELAYRLATEHFVPGGVNRVILATDGDFNVGVTEQSELLGLIESRRQTGVYLSVLGFGEGNIKDDKMELLADKGNGNYAYIDGLPEARKVLVEQATGTLVTIARDVKIQVEFNPRKVGAYRLIGYANRLMPAREFNDDRKDAGEIGAGHTVTALYEVVPPGVEIQGQVDELKYQPPDAPEVPAGAEPAVDAGVRVIVQSDELLTVKLRYKQPEALEGAESTKIEIPITDPGKPLAEASDDFKFASAVAALGMVLRDSEYRGSATCDMAIQLAIAGAGEERREHEAAEYMTDFIHYANTANVDLAAANARALLRLELTDVELGLVMFRRSIAYPDVARAIERARQVEALAELADELHARVTAAQEFLARARIAAASPSYRGEFIELVRKAKKLGAP